MTDILDVLPLDDPRRMRHPGDEEKAYPEHAKLRAREEEYYHLADFMLWFKNDSGYDNYRHPSIRAIIFEFLGVDLKKWEFESETMLWALSAAQGDEEAIEWLKAHTKE